MLTGLIEGGKVRKVFNLGFSFRACHSFFLQSDAYAGIKVSLYSYLWHIAQVYTILAWTTRWKIDIWKYWSENCVTKALLILFIHYYRNIRGMTFLTNLQYLKYFSYRDIILRLMLRWEVVVVRSIIMPLPSGRTMVYPPAPRLCCGLYASSEGESHRIRMSLYLFTAGEELIM